MQVSVGNNWHRANIDKFRKDTFFSMFAIFDVYFFFLSSTAFSPETKYVEGRHK